MLKFKDSLTYRDIYNHVESVLDSTDRSIVVTASMGLGLQSVLSDYLNKFQGTKMVISRKILLSAVYEKELTNDSAVLKTPHKLLREDTDQYIPDLLLVEWPKTSLSFTKCDQVIVKIASQAKRVIYKKSFLDLSVRSGEFKREFLDQELGIFIATKEIDND